MATSKRDLEAVVHYRHSGPHGDCHYYVETITEYFWFVRKAFHCNHRYMVSYGQWVFDRLVVLKKTPWCM